MKNELFYRTISRIVADYNHKAFLASLHKHKGNDRIVKELLAQERALICVLNDAQEDLELEEGLTLLRRSAKAYADTDGLEINYWEIYFAEVR